MNRRETHVIFGTGPLGQAVMRALLERGASIRMVNRSGRADVPASVQVVAGNAYEASSVAALTLDAAVVYQCAQPAYHQWVEQFPPLQAAIVEGVRRSGATLVVGDNLYMYGPVKGPIHERLAYAATTKKGHVRAQMAEALLDAHARGDLRVTIGRASDFFGPAVLASAVGERVFYPALAGKTMQMIGRLDLPHTYTFIDDFGRALVTLGAHDEALGRAWHVPSGETQTTRQFLTLVFEEAGHAPKIQAVPEGLLRALGLFDRNLREISEMTYQWNSPFVLDSSDFARTFGGSPTPNREAIRQTLAWFRAHPQGDAKRQPAAAR
jgi:nucleoside-diphosphate-sugar epimerase